jgi:hypothetical protein
MSEPTASIVCPGCKLRSFNPNDVREKYCGACHLFHSDIIVCPFCEHPSCNPVDVIEKFCVICLRFHDETATTPLNVVLALRRGAQLPLSGADGPTAAAALHEGPDERGNETPDK